jgi:hypothetical protein
MIAIEVMGLEMLAIRYKELGAAGTPRFPFIALGNSA